MNSSAKQQRKTRPVAGARRNRVFDKSIMNEGVYTNPRLIHSTLLLVGCNVQVEVKNGGAYEGIFKTLSPDGHIVLEMAHKVDSQSPNGAVPTKDMIIQSLIFSLGDIVQISATAVDLEFAIKDNFTDPAIAKLNNGGITEKELQPWESDQDGSLEALEKGQSSNGWAPEEMFHINADKFDIKSSYDPSLAQYTTPLVKQDTKEYREREARAAKLAQEIEKSEEYVRHSELENGDEGDEELCFAAVIRPDNNNSGSIASGKYVPPHLRSNRQNNARPAPHQNANNASSPGQSPSPNLQPSPGSSTTVSTVAPPATTASQKGSVQVSVFTGSQEPDNKNEDKQGSDPADRSRSSANTTNSNHNTNTKKIKGRDEVQQELKDFIERFNFQPKDEGKESADRRPPDRKSVV